MKRRNFIKHTSLASTSLLVPSFLNKTSCGTNKVVGEATNNSTSTSTVISQSNTGKNLVIVQFSGGNDGLNTIVPFRNDLYYKNRPNLAVSAKAVLKADNDLGFNPVLTGLKSIYDDGLLSIINNVGYPNPDRSHFRSMDIWHTASASDEYLQTGWLGRYLDHSCSGCNSHHLLEVDDSLSLALKGKQRNGFAMSNPKQLRNLTQNQFLKTTARQKHKIKAVDNIDFLYKTMIDAQSSANYIFEKSKVKKTQTAYPTTEFGRHLKQVAELIMADSDTKIYYVNLTGFDTHVKQQRQHELLLKQYSDGMNALVKDLKTNGLLDNTLIMTFSEFGRRVKENSSMGTDHGTANNLFFIGGKLKKPGFYNEAANLANLSEGDLIHQIDFRRIYATVLEDWLEVDAKRVLGKSFDKLQVV